MKPLKQAIDEWNKNGRIGNHPSWDYPYNNGKIEEWVFALAVCSLSIGFLLIGAGVSFGFLLTIIGAVAIAAVMA